MNLTFWQTKEPKLISRNNATRRIDSEHRLAYKATEGCILIA